MVIIMDRGEPAFVPEWLKSTGSVTGSGSTNNLSTSSSSQSDNHGVPKHAKNKSSASIIDHDIGRSFVSNQTTSAYFRRSSSSNGSVHLRSYRSFGRSHRDRDWEKDIDDYRDKDKSNLVNHWHHDYSDPLGNLLPSRLEKGTLQRAQSLITGKQGDAWPKKIASDPNNGNKSNNNNGAGLLAGGNVLSNVQNSAFKHNFPSLGAEERQGVSEIGRVPSPRFSKPIQDVKSALIGGPGVVGSSSTSIAASHLTTTASSAPLEPSATSGLNMAETLAQGPPRVPSPPQTSIGTQRLEELAIKQSRQLIPLTPSMPKTLVLAPSEKLKPKIGQQHPSHPSTLSPRAGLARSDVAKTSVGKLQVLKPSRDLNGLSSTSKDNLSPTNGGRVVNSPLTVAPMSVGSSPTRTSSSKPAEQRPTTYLKTAEKRPKSQTQSRNDFFKLIKKKSSESTISAVSDPSPAVSPSVLDGSEELVIESGTATFTVQHGDATSMNIPLADLLAKSRDQISNNCGACDGSQKVFSNGTQHSDSSWILFQEEEEIAFLRSLGWEENAAEDEGLTEEEINAFYEEYLKLRPSSNNLPGMQPKISVPLISQHRSCNGASSGSSLSDSQSES